jgi:hypothetical protein
MQAFRLAVAAATMTVFGACSTKPYNPSHFDPPDAKFPGLVDLLAAERTKTLDVFLVHGMCTHDEEWVSDSFAQLEKMLSVVGEGRKEPSLPPGNGIRVFQRTFTVPSGQIRATALLWSPLTTPLKQQLCYDQTTKSDICQGSPGYLPKRASLNAAFKDTVLNDCLADAMVYQGDSRLGIVRKMQEALLLSAATSGGRAVTGGNIAADSLENRAPLVVISSSLGSKVVFDSVYNLVTDPDVSGERKQAGEALFSRTKRIFMGANQIPILGLADQTTDESLAPSARRGKAFPPDPLMELMNRRSTMGLVPGAAEGAPPHVVAFTDPNDLLSYLLRPSNYGPQYSGLVDVWVSNEPTYFGWLERPDTAHRGYLGNDEVASTIACGRPKSRLCK